MSKNKSPYPILENLFNSKTRVKVLKFLFRNYPVTVGVKDLARRVQEQLDLVRKEIAELGKMGLVKVVDRTYYVLDMKFEFFDELRNLILKSSPAEKDRMIRRILGLGRVKLAVVSGVFLNGRDAGTADSEVDLFLVANNVNKDKLRSFLKSLEAEVGKELRFGVMEAKEFEYRYGMFDRFVRVLLDGPHEKLINKLGL